MKNSLFRASTKYPIVAFLCFAVFTSVARSETEIVNIDDTGFLHIRDTKSDSATDDHFIRLPQIISVSIQDESKSGDGFDVVVTTTAIWSISEAEGTGAASVQHLIDFKTRVKAEATVRRLMEMIEAAS